MPDILGTRNVNTLTDGELSLMIQQYPTVYEFREELNRRKLQNIKKENGFFAESVIKEAAAYEHSTSDKCNPNTTNHVWTADSLNVAMKKKAANEVTPGLEMLI